MVISWCESNLAGFPSNDPLWIPDLPRKTWWLSWGKVTNQADQVSVWYLCGLQTANEIFNRFFFIRSRRYSHWIPLKNNQPGDLCREQRLPALVLTGKNLMARSEVSSLLLWNFGGNRDYSKIYCWSWWAELVETTSKHQPITINNPRCF